MARTATKTNGTKVTKSTKSTVKEIKTMAKTNATKKTTTKGNTKATTKTSAKAKTTTKAEPKKFDKQRYIKIAEYLGVRGKKVGCYNFAKPVVYKAMEQEKLTKGDMKKYAEEIMEIARKQGLTWFTGEEEATVSEDEELFA